MRIIIFSGILAAFVINTVAGPFCVVTNYERNCWYYDAMDCREDAEQFGGICVVNERENNSPYPQVDPLPYPELPDPPKNKNEYEIVGEAMQQTGKRIQENAYQMERAYLHEQMYFNSLTPAQQAEYIRSKEEYERNYLFAPLLTLSGAALFVLLFIGIAES
ncbi:hypothetical protein ACFL5V_05775 [Fibrobacterota bacterium]